MRKLRNTSSSGPVVQKREVFLVAGLIASWVVVAFFFVRSNKTEPDFFQPQRRSIHVDQTELTPAILQRYSSAPVSVPEEPSLPQGMAEKILESMKNFSSHRPDSFGLFVTAEPAPPVMASETLILEQETVMPEESSGQEGEFLESEPPEPVAPPSVEQPASASEPVKL